MKTVKLQAVCSVAVVAISVLWMSQGRLWPSEVRLDALSMGRSQFSKFRPKTAQAVPGRYIVRLKSSAAGFPGQNSRGAEVAAQIGRDHGISNISNVRSKFVNRFVVEISEERARALSLDWRVDSVEQSTWGTGLGSSAAGNTPRRLTIQPNPEWGLDRIDQRFGGGNLDGQYAYENSGVGVDVYLLDMGDDTGGIRMSHGEFDGRVSDSGINYSPPSNVTCDPEDEDCNKIIITSTPPAGCEHATNMAGIIGGEEKGVAKGTSIIYGKVINCNNVIFGDLAANAVEDVIDLHVASGRPSVLNLSWAVGGNDALDAAVIAAMNAGITVVAAAGNRGGDPQAAPHLHSPQRVGGVILVGASTVGDARWVDGTIQQSAFGPLLDLFAPGYDIQTASNTDDDEFSLSKGTSASAAFVSGVAAMYLQSNPSASPAAVSQALVNNATPNELSNVGPGSPNLLVYSSFITSGGPTCPPDCPPGGSGTERLVSLAADNGQFMVAEGNGGGTVNANRNSAGSWETFTMVDFNGGELWDGDLVGLRAGDGSYLQAVGGGGGEFLAVGGGLWAWETFRVHAESGSDGRIDDNEWLSLETFDGHYVVAEGGGGGIVNADRTGVGAWERFRLVIW